MYSGRVKCICWSRPVVLKGRTNTLSALKIIKKKKGKKSAAFLLPTHACSEGYFVLLSSAIPQAKIDENST